MSKSVAKQIDLSKNKELVSRMMAAQACYQLLQNQRPIKEIVQEYLERGMPIEMGADEDSSDIQTFKPHGTLFTNILTNLHQRLGEVDLILKSTITKPNSKDQSIAEPSEEAEGADTQQKTQKDIEPLLKSIMLCGITELLCHEEIDAPLIVNDYIDVTHSFYGKGQAGFVNGLLDTVAKAVRT